ncbi:MAG: acyl-CoA thioesterase II [Microthrixaceae bacterium]|nr:acyl-CoA thioesterase II [Microthrixaceae bacterium]HMS11855.1 acyl-CoA thioesterase II [Microthrixaceae bacterium]HMT24049.1 acyl-CoA thioesterase II [Microthrixaceae bacterium]HMT59295.1 acyl-CoA thioesterase II [Microthrixaceae bacterium]
MDQSAVDALIELLDLEPIEVNVFRGRSPNEDRQRVFGGQVAGQALVAAARTVEGMAVHSLHSYFLVPGDPTSPILYLVDRLRDTRSFTTRRVVAVQHGRPIFELSASFQRPEAGFDHQMAMPTGLPDPESLPDFKTRLAPWKAQLGEWYDRPRPIDTRYCNWQPPDDRSPGPMLDNVWFRAAGRLPDDPVLHTCVVTYSSDFTVLDTSVRPHGGSGLGDVFMASLDHAMWFHRPFRADDWLLYAQDTPSASGGRGLGRGMIFARDGSLVASVVQEGVIRPARRAD